MPHDDLLKKTYIQKMIQGLKSNPNACVVFSDIQGFGLNKSLISQKSIKGNRLERAIEFLNQYYNAVAFRGLVDRKKISDFLFLSENNPSNFAIDTIWNLQMALKGELVRVHEVLYHKRYYEESVHASWQKPANEVKIKMWVQSIAAPTVLLVIAHEGTWFPVPVAHWFKLVAVWATVVVTALSTIHYLVRSRHILEESAAT